MAPILLNTIPESASGYTLKTYKGERFSLPLHQHEKYEFTWIVKGEGTRIIGDNISSFVKDDILLLGPKLPHQWQSEPNLCREVEAISLFIEKDYLGHQFWKNPSTRHLTQILNLTSRGLIIHNNLKTKLMQLFKMLKTASQGRGMIIVLDMLQSISESNDFEPLCSPGYCIPVNVDSSGIGKVTDYILQHIQEKLSVSELSEIACMHPNSLSREFRRMTGFSIVEYINKIRIGNAVRYLRETNATVLDICYRCGFQNLSNFNRQFKKVMGCSPSRYRK